MTSWIRLSFEGCCAGATSMVAAMLFYEGDWAPGIAWLLIALIFWFGQ